MYQTQRSSSYSIRIPAENHTRNQALTDIWSWIYVISEIVYVQARPVFEEASADQATAVTFAIVIILTRVSIMMLVILNPRLSGL